MTLICYVKPQMFLTPTRPSINDPPLSLNQTLHSLICFSRLQGMTINTFKVGFLTPSKVLSLSAQSLPYEAAGPSGFGAPRPRVFSTPRQVCSSRTTCGFIPLRLHSQGFCLQSLPAIRSVSFVRTHAPSLSALLHGFLQSVNQMLPNILTTPALPRRDLNLPIAPCHSHDWLPS